MKIRKLNPLSWLQASRLHLPTGAKDIAEAIWNGLVARSSPEPRDAAAAPTSDPERRLLHVIDVSVWLKPDLYRRVLLGTPRAKVEADLAQWLCQRQKDNHDRFAWSEEGLPRVSIQLSKQESEWPPFEVVWPRADRPEQIAPAIGWIRDESGNSVTVRDGVFGVSLASATVHVLGDDVGEVRVEAGEDVTLTRETDEDEERCGVSSLWVDDAESFQLRRGDQPLGTFEFLRRNDGPRLVTNRREPLPEPRKANPVETAHQSGHEFPVEWRGWRLTAGCLPWGLSVGPKVSGDGFVFDDLELTLEIGIAGNELTLASTGERISLQAAGKSRRAVVRPDHPVQVPMTDLPVTLNLREFAVTVAPFGDGLEVRAPQTLVTVREQELTPLRETSFSGVRFCGRPDDEGWVVVEGTRMGASGGKK